MTAPGAWRWTLLMALTAAVYASACTYWFLAWDDPGFVHLNPLLVGVDWRHLCAVWTSPVNGNYLPITMMSYLLDFQWWGMIAGGYHLVNLLWHLLNTVLCYRCCRAVGLRAGPAWWAGALFALHPVQVESVVWISERKNLLAAAGVLAALWSYHRSSDRRSAAADGWWWSSVVCGALALLSKPSAVALPLLCAAHDRWVCRLAWSAALKRSGPFWMMAAATAWLAIWANGIGGTVRAWHGDSLWATLWTLPRVWLRYAQLVAWPADVSFWYDIDDSRAWHDSRVWLALVVLGAVTLLLRQWARATPRVAWWSVWTVAALLPTANLVPLEPWMHDRYLYLPLIGVSGLVAEGVQALGRRALVQRHGPMLLVAGGVVLCALTALTLRRVHVWRDGVTLWSDAVQRSPRAAFPRVLLGQVLADAARREEADAMWWSAADAEPASWQSWSVRAMVLWRRGRHAEALAAQERMYQVAERRTEVQLARAEQAFHRADWPSAVEAYAEILRRQPQHVVALRRLGLMAMRLDRPQEAVRWFRRALQVEPWNVPVRRRLVQALRQSSDATAEVVRREAAVAEHWRLAHVRLAAAHRRAAASYQRWSQPAHAVSARRAADQLEQAQDPVAASDRR